MAGPQSLTPQPVFPSRPRRHFTLEQANRSLALVKRIAADIVRMHTQVSEIQKKLKSGRNQQQLQQELEGCMARFNDYTEELDEIGCELKDPASGLIDWVGRHKGHDVYLCWKLGEERITHWHELQAGFAGRQPVSSLVESE